MGKFYLIECCMANDMTDQDVSHNKHILSLVNEALKDIETPIIPLSTVIRKSIHIARLRNDYINLWWLDWEMTDITNREFQKSIIREIIPYISKEDLKSFWTIFLERYMAERKYIKMNNKLEIEQNEDNILGKSIPEIEVSLRIRKQEADHLVAPQGLNPVDLYFVDKSRSEIRVITLFHIENLELILERIKHRVHKFLSFTEKQLLFGQINADIFEINRRFVDFELGRLCPEAVSQFVLVYHRLPEKDTESYAQALTSCRRILKSLADVLYPPSSKRIIGSDGRQHNLSDDKYIARLWQYVYEKTAHSTSGKLLQAEVQYLGNRIDKLYDLTNKGIHANISDFEVNQCVIQTYLLIGDILRISKDQPNVHSDEVQSKVPADCN
jgi:hypothetical protein